MWSVCVCVLLLYLGVFTPSIHIFNSFIMSFANKILSKISILIAIRWGYKKFIYIGQNRDFGTSRKKHTHTHRQAFKLKKMDITMVQLIKWPNVPTKCSNEANCFYGFTWLHNGKLNAILCMKINDAWFRKREMTICWHGSLCSLSK